MTRTRVARLMGLMASLLVGLALASSGVAAAQSQAQEIFICHRTGSPTNPWVFMRIDASTWPEHEAAGDMRANSLADCPAPAPAPAPAAQEAAPTAPAAEPAQPAQTAVGVPQAAAPAQASSSQVANAQVASPEQARSQTAEAQAQADSAPVSSLPASGEPNRPVLVAGLLTLLAAGLGLRRLGRSHA